MTQRPRRNLNVLRGLWRNRSFVGRSFDTIVAIACLTFCYQCTWLAFQHVTSWVERNYPNSDIWLASKEPVEFIVPPNRVIVLSVNGLERTEWSSDGRLTYGGRLQPGWNHFYIYVQDEPEKYHHEWIFDDSQFGEAPLLLGTAHGMNGALLLLGFAAPLHVVEVRSGSGEWKLVDHVPNDYGIFLHEIGAQERLTQLEFRAGRDTSTAELTPFEGKRPDSVRRHVELDVEAIETSLLKFDLTFQIYGLVPGAAGRLAEALAPGVLVEALGLAVQPRAREYAVTSVSETGLSVVMKGIDLIHLRLLGAEPAPLMSFAGDTLRLTAPPSISVQGIAPAKTEGYTRIFAPPASGRDVRLDIARSPPKSDGAAFAADGQSPKLSDLPSSLQALQRRTPRQAAIILYGLLAAIPIIGLLWILRAFPDAAPRNRRKLMAVAYSFLFFHVGIYSIQLFRSGFDFIAPLEDLGAFDAYAIDLFRDIGRGYPLIILGVLLLVRPMYQVYWSRQVPASTARRLQRQFGRWLLFWPAIVLLPIAFFYLLRKIVPRGLYGEDPDVYGEAPDVYAFMWMVILALLSLWFVLLWLCRSIANGKIKVRAVVVASLAMLLLPFLPVSLEVFGAVARNVWVSSFQSYPFLIPSNIDDGTWLLIISTVGAGLLMVVTELSIQLSQHRPSFNFIRSPWRFALIPVFLLFCFPMGRFLWEYRVEVNVEALVELGFAVDYLLRYTILIGLVLFICVSNPTNRFRLSESTLVAGTFVFAFYLAGGTVNLWFVPIPLLLGWVVFRYWVLCPKTPEGASRDDAVEIVNSILEYRRAERLEAYLRKHPDKVAGKENPFVNMKKVLEQAREYTEQAKSTIPAGLVRAKSLLFARGAETGPLSNARIAIKYGAVLSLPFVISTIIERAQSAELGNFPFLELTRLTLFAATTWLVIAFVFGYFFHVIRGQNGLIKALCFSAAVAIATVPSRLIHSQPVLGVDHVVELVQIVLFVLLLALLAFDLRRLRQIGFGWREFLAVHGLTTSAGYASSIILAAAASVSGKDLVQIGKDLLSLLFG